MLLHLCDSLGLLLLGARHIGLVVGLLLELLGLVLLLEIGLGLGKLLLLLLGELEQGLLLVGAEVVVVGTDNAVGVVDGERTDVGHGLDLESHSLDLGVGHLQTELVGT